MKFTEVVIYEWYDNIISAFCKDDSNAVFYCNLLAMDDLGVEKIYVCIELKYFAQSDAILSIIEQNTFLADEDKLKDVLTMIMFENESYLVKTNDLRASTVNTVKYKSNFNWNNGLFSIDDYPSVLKIAMRIDDWWNYFKPTDGK